LERVMLRACQGEVDAVGQFCYALLERDHPDSPLVLEALAVGNLKLLRFAAAADALDRWLALVPDEPQAVFLKGRLQLQAGNNTEALDFLRHAVELDPTRDEPRLMLAGLLLDLGQAEEALTHLEWVCRRQPRNFSAKARMGQALVLLGRPEEAIPLLDDVIAQRPDVPIALLERGKLALRDEQHEQAERWLREACQRDVGDRSAHYQYLQCLKQMDKTKEARRIQERLDAIDAGSTRVHEIITVELPERRFDPELHAELGELLLDVGLDKDGTAWLQRALQIDPSAPRAHRAFAKYYNSLGQTGLARQHLALADAADGTGKEPLQ
jgi:tetratricopeptide (TPR) repeat protein